MLHFLETKIHGEVTTARFTVPNLNRTGLVMSQPVFVDGLGFAEDASVDCDWFEYDVFPYGVSQS
jgi:hypothetical protein